MIPAYIESTCCKPKAAILPTGSTSSTGCASPSALSSAIFAPLAEVSAVPGEARGFSLGLDPHLDGVRPSVERRLHDFDHSFEHLPAPSGEHRGLRPGLVGETRLAGSLLRRLYLL